MFYRTLLLSLLLLARTALPAQCDKFDGIMKKAETLWAQGDFEKAFAKLAVAREVCSGRAAEVDAKYSAFIRDITDKYNLVERQKTALTAETEKAKAATTRAEAEKTKAEKAALHAYANDLAYKSQTALRDGDRTAAFRLAEFAQRYVEAGNPNVLRALVEALYYNDAPARPPLPWNANLEGHTSYVGSVAFSPDGKRLATGSYDKTAKIWDLDTGKSSLTLEGHTSSVRSVAFSPDGRRLATGSDDKTAKIWDLDSGKSSLTLEGHTYYVGSVAFSPDGKRLATGSDDYTAKIWDLDTGKSSLTLEGHSLWVSSVAFSPDGKRLATGSYDMTAKIWELDADSIIRQLHERQRLAALIEPQLEQWDMETLLSAQPGNEERLLATGEVWQIAAFADLLSKKIAQTGFPKQEDYDRAMHLYRACLASGVDNGYFEQKIAALEKVWQEKTGVDR